MESLIHSHSAADVTHFKGSRGFPGRSPGSVCGQEVKRVAVECWGVL